MKRACALLLLLSACAAPRANRVDRSACAHQADEEWRLCRNPQPLFSGEEPRVRSGEEIQSCDRAHEQALRRCAGYDSEEVPPIDLGKTSTQSQSKSSSGPGG